MERKVMRKVEEEVRGKGGWEHEEVGGGAGDVEDGEGGAHEEVGEQVGEEEDCMTGRSWGMREMLTWCGLVV